MLNITSTNIARGVVLALLFGALVEARDPVIKVRPDARGGKAAASNRSSGRGEYVFAEVPTPEGASSVTYDINERGQYAGTYDYYGPDGSYIGSTTFFWDGKSLQTIAYPGAIATSVVGINAAGTRLSGNWGGYTESTSGYYDLRDGTFHVIQPTNPTYPINYITRANDAGLALGQSCMGDVFQPTDCIWWLGDGKNFEILPLPAGPIAGATYVNNRREVTGFVGDGISFSGYVVRNGVFSWLYPPGVNSTELIPRAITNSGLILANGETDPNSFWQPFLYDGASTRLLPEYATGGQTTYTGLNEKGDLAGLFFDGTTFRYKAIVAYRK